MFGACGVDVHFWGFLRFGVGHDGIDSVGFRLMDVFWESVIVATKRILIICIRIALTFEVFARHGYYRVPGSVPVGETWPGAEVSFLLHVSPLKRSFLTPV